MPYVRHKLEMGERCFLASQDTLIIENPARELMRGVIEFCDFLKSGKLLWPVIVPCYSAHCRCRFI